tara:strand:- start:391 stop:861 length:471 start_codon:yes stop_codon:yes gene_type:complete
MSNLINKKFLIVLLTIISLALVSTFIIEHQLGYQPCKLCIYERIPYFLAILFIINIFFVKSYERITLLILSLIFIASSILAFYHFGIEQGFFEESLFCKAESLTKEELLKELSQNTISCKDVSFKILGFSLASINTIFSIILSVIFAKLFKNYGKN